MLEIGKRDLIQHSNHSLEELPKHGKGVGAEEQETNCF